MPITQDRMSNLLGAAESILQQYLNVVPAFHRLANEAQTHINEGQIQEALAKLRIIESYCMNPHAAIAEYMPFLIRERVWLNTNRAKNDYQRRRQERVRRERGVQPQKYGAAAQEMGRQIQQMYAQDRALAKGEELSRDIARQQVGNFGYTETDREFYANDEVYEAAMQRMGLEPKPRLSPKAEPKPELKLGRHEAQRVAEEHSHDDHIITPTYDTSGRRAFKCSCAVASGKLYYSVADIAQHTNEEGASE